MSATLISMPDWLYLVREFDYAYRHGSAGGSPAVRSHMKAVRNTLAKVQASNTELVLPDPANLPVNAHLERALDNGIAGAMASMVKAVENVKTQLAWQYGYEKMPRHLIDKYAYAEIMGPSGPIVSQDLILGLVLFAPRTTYPAHSHAGITESYISLSGYWSENDTSVYPPSSLVLNLPPIPTRSPPGTGNRCSWAMPGRATARAWPLRP